jgi:hypothetical protein
MKKPPTYLGKIPQLGWEKSAELFEENSPICFFGKSHHPV